MKAPAAPQDARARLLAERTRQRDHLEIVNAVLAARIDELEGSKRALTEKLAEVTEALAAERLPAAVHDEAPDPDEREPADG